MKTTISVPYPPWRTWSFWGSTAILGYGVYDVWSERTLVAILCWGGILALWAAALGYWLGWRQCRRYAELLAELGFPESQDPDFWKPGSRAEVQER